MNKHCNDLCLCSHGADNIFSVYWLSIDCHCHCIDSPYFITVVLISVYMIES